MFDQPARVLLYHPVDIFNSIFVLRVAVVGASVFSLPRDSLWNKRLPPATFFSLPFQETFHRVSLSFLLFSIFVLSASARAVVIIVFPSTMRNRFYSFASFSCLFLRSMSRLYPSHFSFLLYFLAYIPRFESYRYSKDDGNKEKRREGEGRKRKRE